MTGSIFSFSYNVFYRIQLKLIQINSYEPHLDCHLQIHSVWLISKFCCLVLFHKLAFRPLISHLDMLLIFLVCPFVHCLSAYAFTLSILFDW